MEVTAASEESNCSKVEDKNMIDVNGDIIPCKTKLILSLD